MKVLCNFSRLADHLIESWRQDLVVVDKKNRSCKVIWNVKVQVILLFLPKHSGKRLKDIGIAA